MLLVHLRAVAIDLRSKRLAMLFSPVYVALLRVSDVSTKFRDLFNISSYMNVRQFWVKCFFFVCLSIGKLWTKTVYMAVRFLHVSDVSTKFRDLFNISAYMNVGQFWVKCSVCLSIGKLWTKTVYMAIRLLRVSDASTKFRDLFNISAYMNVGQFWVKCFFCVLVLENYGQRLYTWQFVCYALVTRPQSSETCLIFLLT
jgi:hypothetical protein